MEKLTEELLQQCAEEPIHIPGKIQPHGYLMAIDKYRLRIKAVSDNLHEVCSVHPKDLLNASLEEVFSKELCSTMQRLAQGDTLKQRNPYKLEWVSASFCQLNPQQYQLLIYPSGESMVLLEIEPQPSEGKLNKGDELGQHYEKVFQFLNEQDSEQQLFERVVAYIKEFTSYDRVMLYKFDEEWNGAVIAESVDNQYDPFLGLHYPTTDIPAQARELYKKNLLRLIADVQYEPVFIRSAEKEELDLSYAQLRSVSPMHIEYLNNMGVRATLVISLVVEGELWGLLACHHYQDAKFVSYQERKLLEHIARLFSYQIHIKQQKAVTERMNYVQNVLAQIEAELNLGKSLQEVLIHSEQHNLLSINSSMGAALRYKGTIYTVGDCPPEAQIERICEWVESKMGDQPLYQSHHLIEEMRLSREEDQQIIHKSSSLLAVRLFDQFKEYILWFKPEKKEIVNWAGNPEKAVKKDASGKGFKLSPRDSFEKWQETVQGKGEEWTEADLEAAMRLRRSVINAALAESERIRMKNENLEGQNSELEQRLLAQYYELDRANQLLKKEIALNKQNQQRLVEAKELAEQMNQLKSNFLANMSHEVRTPLNGILGISSIIEEEAGDSEIQNYAKMVRQSGKRLLHTLNDILDLSKIEAKRIELDIKTHNLIPLIADQLGLLHYMSKEKGLELEPRFAKDVISSQIDEEKFIQVINNLLSNAIKYSDEGTILVQVEESYLDDQAYALISIIDEGQGIDPEFMPHLFDAFQQESHGWRRKAQGTGLGLAITKKLVEMHNGQITVESEKGKGSTFQVYLPLAFE